MAACSRAPRPFDVILTNPPFGGKEGKDAQTSSPSRPAQRRCSSCSTS